MTRRVAWGVWLVSMGLLVTGLALLAVSEPDAMLTDLGWLPAMATVVFVFCFATVGALVSAARPRNPVGWILAAAGLCFALGGFAISSITAELPGWMIMGWLSGWVWGLGVGLAGTFLLLLFPHGQLPSPHWRPAAWLAAAGITAVTVSAMLSPVEELQGQHPLGVELDATVLRTIGGAGLAAMVVSVCLSLAAVVVRFRRSRRAERQQMKWLASSAALVAVGLATGVVLEAVWGTSEVAINVSNTIISGALATVPITAGVAILRHRLYEIDRIISRTLAYGLLTGVLVAVYAAAVLVLGQVLAPVTQGSELAVAGSTLVVAALFGPVRRRVQAGVDRRFNRSRYDAERIVAAFRARLRDEVDLDTLSADLLGAVGATVEPRRVALWLRPTRR